MRRRRYSNCPEINELVRETVASGFATVQRGGKHWKLMFPSTGRVVPVAGSPSDFHAPANARRQVARELAAAVHASSPACTGAGALCAAQMHPPRGR